MISLAPVILSTEHFLHAARLTLHISKHAARILGITAALSALSFVAINVLLLLMQITTLPLFAKAGDISLGLKTPAEAKVLLTSHGQSELYRLTIQEHTYNTSAQKAGIALDTTTVLNRIQHPSGWDRLPLLQALHNFRSKTPLAHTIDDRQLKKYLATIQLPGKADAVNARVVIPADSVAAAYIEPEKTGYFYSTDQLAAQTVQQIRDNQALAISAEPQVLQPTVTASQLASALAKTNSLLGSNFTITNNSFSYTLTPSDLRKVVVVATSASGLSEPNIDTAQVVELLRSYSNSFYTAPGTSKVSLVDGKVVASTEGSAGEAIDINASAKLVATALLAGKTEQAVAMTKVNPATTYLRSYTATSAGLQTLIQDFAATHKGSYKVAVVELGGNRSAYYKQDVSVVPASTYKLFVAYAALKKIEQGSLSLGSSTSAGSLDACMQKMILVSDNTCAKAIFDRIGWAEVQSVVASAGFGSTNINNSGGGYMSSTASDIADLLVRLYDGSLLSQSSTDYLFGLMKQQVYRSGIPAGSPGAVVADKVGFLYSWNHDAAIVYGAKSTYVLVVMTTDSGFAQIKELSSQVYNLLNQ